VDVDGMDAIVEPPRMDSRRFAEVSAHAPAGQALDNHEGKTFNHVSNTNSARS